MSSLLDLLTQKQPHFQTHQALIILDLQNDFLLPDGKLPVSSRSGFLGRIRRLVPTFRDNAGDIIWIRTVHEKDRSANDGTDEIEVVITNVEADGEGKQDEDYEAGAAAKEVVGSQASGPKSSSGGRSLLKKITRKQSAPAEPAKPTPGDDPELFLSSSATRKPCCLPNTKGVDFYEDMKKSIDPQNDVIMTKSYYSAFNSTQLLMTLRMRLITELYICGCMTNLSVYATALDAARHGLTINIVEDCLGFRKASRHQEALRQMSDVMGAYRVSSLDLLTELAEQDPEAEIDTSRILSPEPPAPTRASEPEPPPESVRESTPDPAPEPKKPKALHDMVKELRLSDTSSLYSTKEKESESKRSPELVRPGSRIAESLTQSLDPTPHLRRKPSAKLQKKPPVSSRPRESPTTDTPTAEAAEHSLKYKRSKIRMRKREPSVGPRDSLAILDRPSQPVSLPESSGRQSRRPPQLTTATRRSAEEPLPSPLLSPLPPTSRGSERSGPVPPSRDASSAPSSRLTSPARGSSRGSNSRSPRASEKSSPVQSPVLGKGEYPKTDLLSPTSSMAASAFDRQSSSATLGARSSASTTGSGYSSSSTGLAMPKASELAIGEGDSYLTTSILPPPQAATIFSDLYNEVRWQSMFHQTGAVPRLVCVQGDFGNDGSMPIYRHPTDHALPLLHYSPAVQVIRNQAERVVRHPLNHCLIQLYRSGQDYISEHSDKTLDIVRGSSTVNVSFGAQRTMRLRTKKSALNQQSISFAEAARQTHRIPLPHNSAFVLGQETNMRWLHGITPDKRPQSERSDAEKAFSGMRISLTFRHIGTHLNPDSTLIWGQGATSKTRDGARPVVNNDMRRTEAMVRAFGKENQASEFDWNESYGNGFDVLNFRKLPSDNPAAALLFLSNDSIENEQIRTYLDEASFEYVPIDAPTKEADDKMGCVRKICFRDNDPLHTEVTGAMAVLLYLDRLRPLPHRITADGADEKPVETRASIARTYELLGMLTEAVDGVRKGEKWLLSGIEGYLGEDSYVTGKGFSFADCAYFPVLERCWEGWDEQTDGEVPRVKAYLERMKKRLASRTSREKESREELRRQLSMRGMGA